jgi:hypothetical protein
MVHRCPELETHISDENERKIEFEACPHMFEVRQRHTTVDDYLEYINGDFSQQIWSDFWKFAFVRNPWDRVVSLYYWHYQIASPKMAIKFQKQYPTVGDWIPQLYHNWKTSQMDSNLLPQHNWTHHKGETKAVDFIGRFENIKEDNKIVMKHMGLPEDTHFGHHNATKRNDYKTYYTDETADQIAQIFARDIELFGYTFEGK